VQISSALHLAEQRRRVLQAQLEARREARPQLEANSTASASSPRSENALSDQPEPPQGMTWAMANAINLVKQTQSAAGLCVARAAAFDIPSYVASHEIEDPSSGTGTAPVGTEIARPPAPESAQDAPTLAAAPRILTHVKTFVELNLAALQAKQDGLLRLHYVLKAHDLNGQGWVSEETARDATSFMYAWAGARYWLRKGDGVWWKWDKPAGRIHLRKPGVIAAALGVPPISRRPVAIPLEALATEAGASAALYATVHTERQAEAEERAKRIVVNAFVSGRAAAAPYEANPISKQTLSDMTGLHRSTLSRYDKIARLKKKQNFTLFHLSDTPANRDALKARGIAGVFRYRQVTKRRGRKPVYDNLLAARLPDTFEPAPGQSTMKRNSHRRINRTIADLASRLGAGHQSERQGPTDKRRLTRFYYDSAQKLEKAAKKDGSRDRYWRRKRDRGRVWWQCYESTRHDEVARLDPQERAWLNRAL
jgi:hypothetical protein